MRVSEVSIDTEKFLVSTIQKCKTFEKLAELSGVSRATIFAIKAGKACSRGTAEKLAAVLGCEIIDGGGVDEKAEEKSGETVESRLEFVIRAPGWSMDEIEGMIASIQKVDANAKIRVELEL